jgi:hypothetical protein
VRTALCEAPDGAGKCEELSVLVLLADSGGLLVGALRLNKAPERLAGAACRSESALPAASPCWLLRLQAAARASAKRRRVPGSSSSLARSRIYCRGASDSHTSAAKCHIGSVGSPGRARGGPAPRRHRCFRQPARSAGGPTPRPCARSCESAPIAELRSLQGGRVQAREDTSEKVCWLIAR